MLVPLTFASGLFAPAHALPDTNLAIGTVEARLATMIGTGDGCLRVSPTGGDPGWSAWVSTATNPAMARTAHGRSGSTCPTNLSTSSQSAIEAKPNNPGAVTESLPFLLSTFTHYNNSVSRAANESSSAMELRFLGTTLNLPWKLEETSNTADVCDYGATDGVKCNDRLAFDTNVADQIITINGVEYRLVVTGFTAATRGVCSNTLGTQSVQSAFITKEGAQTVGCMYAQLDRIRKLTIKKVTQVNPAAPAGTTAPSTDFTFSSASDINGSQWAADTSFSLANGVSETREILSSEKVTINESSAGDEWALKGVRCVDQKGATVGLSNGGGATNTNPLVIDDIVKMATTPAAITCTYTNEYTPRGTLTLKKVLVGGPNQISDFTLSAAGPDSISGIDGAASVTARRVTAGDYTLAETNKPGYEASWACTGGALSAGKVTVARGANVTCTVTNRYKVGTVEVQKTVDPSAGYTGGTTQAFTGEFVCKPTTGTGTTYTFSSKVGTNFSQADVPAGYSCVVTKENVPTAGLASSYAWDDPQFGPAKTVTDGETTVITVNNRTKRVYGELKLKKLVNPASGTSAAYTGGARTFPLGYRCTLGTEKWESTVDVAKDGTSAGIAIPLGATCSFSETTPNERSGDFPDSSYFWKTPDLPNNVTIGTTSQTVTFTNIYERRYGAIKIKKTVTGPAAANLQPADQTFTIGYDCGTGFKNSVSVKNNETTTISSLPLNASCTVEEKPTPSGSTGLPSWAAWDTASSTTTGSAVVKALTAADTVTITNATKLAYGQIAVAKALAGAAEGLKTGETFNFTIACTPPTGSGVSAKTYTPSIQAGAANAWTSPAGELPVGTSCEVTETAPAQTQLLNDSYAWGSTPGKVAVVASVGAGATESRITVRNTINRVYSALEIDKVVVNNTGAVLSPQTFSGTWDCGSGQSGEWTATGSGPATITKGDATKILVGSQCTVTETSTSAPVTGDDKFVWKPAVYAPAGGVVTILKGEPQKVTVTNEVDQVKAGVSLVKSVTGATTGLVAGSDFSFNISCVDGPSFTETRKNGASAVLTPNLPVGKECTITEVMPRPVTSNPERYTWATPTWASSSATLALIPVDNGVKFTVPTGNVQITATNPIVEQKASLTVAKEITGEVAGHVAGSTFPMSVTCVAAGDLGTKDATTAAPAVFENIPVTDTCKVTEGAVWPATKDDSYAWDSTATYVPATASTTGVKIARTGSSVTVKNNLTRVTGALKITKTLIDPDKVTAVDRDYSGTWECTYDGAKVKEGSWKVKAGETTTLATDVPLTSTCSATEAALAAPSNDPSYVWKTPAKTITPVTVSKTGAASAPSLEVTNEVIRQTGELQVKKQVVGPGYSGSGNDFTINYTCTLAGQTREYKGQKAVAADNTFVTLADGIPFGWSCSITETTPDRDLLDDRSYAWEAVTNPVATVTLNASKPSAEVTVVNKTMRTYGAFAITKTIEDTPTAAITSGFSGGFTCTKRGATDVNGTWTAPASGGLATLKVGGNIFGGDVLTGSECSVTEDLTDGLPRATLVDASWAWDAPRIGAAQEVAEGSTATIDVKNSAHRMWGALDVTKVYSGPLAALKSGAKVNGTWTCTYDGATQNGAWELPASGGKVTLFDATTVVKVPATAECEVVESAPLDSAFKDGSYSWTADSGTKPSPAKVTLVGGQKPAVTITNTAERVYGELVIDKVVAGGTADAGNQYGGTYSCVYGDDKPVTGEWKATEAGNFSVGGILVGSVCTVAETTVPAPQAADRSWIWVSKTPGAPATVVGPESQTPATVVVTNTMQRVTGSFSVVKELTGAEAKTLGDPTFTFTWSCTPGINMSGSFTLKAGEKWDAPDGVPDGANCTVSETKPVDPSVSYSWQKPTWAATGLGGENSTLNVSDNGLSASGQMSVAGGNHPVLTVTNSVLKNSYSLTKSSDPADGSTVRPGDVITYRLTVTPTGGTVHNVVVTDDLAKVLDNATLVADSITAPTGTATLSGSTLVWKIPSLSGTQPVTATYQVKVGANAWNAVLRNVVTSKADEPETPGGDTETEHPVPGYRLTKVSDPASGSVVTRGQTVTYTLTAINTSQAVVQGAKVTDKLAGVLANATLTTPLGKGLSLEGTTLTWLVPDIAIGGQQQVSYAVTIKDSAQFNASVKNVVTPDGPGVCTEPGRCTTDNTVENPALQLTKAAAKVKDLDNNGVDAGDTIDYSFTVTNTGNVALTQLQVTDPKFPDVVFTCKPDSLPADPTLKADCGGATYTLTQDDLDKSLVTNTATASGLSPSKAKVTDDDTTRTGLTGKASIQVDKSASVIVDGDKNGIDAGDDVTFGFTVTNTGAVSLTKVALTDPLLGGAMTCPKTVLAGGESMTCTSVVYKLTQADVDAGKVVNTAEVVGTPPGEGGQPGTGTPVKDDDTRTVPASGSSALTLTKTAGAVVDGDGNGADAGDTISYVFAVENTGTLTLTEVAVTDPKFGDKVFVCTPSTLAPGAKATCGTATYSLTQADVDKGLVENTATASGLTPSKTKVTDDDSTRTVAAGKASIEVVKSVAGGIKDVDGNGVDVGDEVTFGFTVTNTGAVSLSKVALTDPLLGGAMVCPKAELAGGESMTCTSMVYKLTQADVDAGKVVNTAEVVGTPPGEGGQPGTGSPVKDQDTVTVTGQGVGKLELDKVAGALVDNDNNGPDAGDTITYTFSVTNTGQLTLKDAKVSDPKFPGQTFACTPSTLAPGAKASCGSATYTVTAADVAAKVVNNTATATGTMPDGKPATGTDSTTTPVIAIVAPTGAPASVAPVTTPPAPVVPVVPSASAAAASVSASPAPTVSSGSGAGAVKGKAPKGKYLPSTGASAAISWAATFGLALATVGLALIAAARVRRPARQRH